MSRKVKKPGALDEFLERQELGTYPTRNVGNFRSSIPFFMLSRFPLIQLLAGASLAGAAIIGLINALPDLADNWLNLIIYMFMIALSVLFFISGIRSLRSNAEKRKARRQ